MDKLDFQIMAELMHDSRIPVTHLAKRLGVSREVTTYRMKRLEDEKVILGYVTEINTTAPTGIIQLVHNGGPDISTAFWDYMERLSFTQA